MGLAARRLPFGVAHRHRDGCHRRAQLCRSPEWADAPQPPSFAAWPALRRACLERSPVPVAVDCDAVHHPALAVGLADELPNKNWTGQPPLIFPVVVLRRSPVNRRSKVLPGQCLPRSKRSSSMRNRMVSKSSAARDRATFPLCRLDQSQTPHARLRNGSF